MTISLRNSFSVIALSAALMMGACGPKDKAGSPQISAEAAPLGLKAASDKDFARHFAVPERTTSEADANKALALLGMAESGATDLTWAAREGSNGNYTFTNLSSNTDDGVVMIETAVLTGVHMEGDAANFDRADFTGVSMTGDDLTVKVKNMTVARPTPDTAKAILKSIEKMSDSDDKLSLEMEDDDLDIGFGAISVADVTVSGDEVSGTINQMVYGTDAQTERTDFKVSDVNLTIQPRGQSDASAPSLLTMKSLTGRGFLNASDQMDMASGGLGALLGSLNMYEKPYDSFSLDSLIFNNSNVEMNIAGFEGEATTKGDVTTIRQVGKPMVFKLKEAPKAMEARQFYKTMSDLGFDNITIKSSQVSVLDEGKDTIRVNDGILEMTDGFKLNYTYGASGLKEVQQAMNTGTSQTAQQRMAMQMLKLNDMKISLEDKSIVERGLKLAAEMRGADPERVKKEMRAAVTMAPLLARSDLEKDLASELGGAFMEFIEKGGTLTIEMAPTEPLPMADLMALQQNGGSLKDLGFTAEQSD
ncbi:hypothetical protein ACJ3XI_01355 [Litorimonas sp. RW-G-Af-16]|uniref:hypothetical protein n=1 Tax=Litorimonas sp. RW-G-Af-16 TaxID=3241168 RepID=UPI00390C6D32